jgi:DNA-binding NtrC family response regulator
MSRRVLIVDDDQSMCELLEADLRQRGFHVSWHTSAEEGFQVMMDEEFDVALTDLRMSGMNGIDFCDRCVANRPDVPVIVMTAFGSLETAVAAIRAGAYDFVSKPIEMDMLALTLERAVNHRVLKEKVKILSQALKKSHKFDEIIGQSQAMENLYDLLTRIADSDTSVLITGESGTGKELVAQVLHRQSFRKTGPFVAINCAALPDQLLENELFGHTQGAFTDARAIKKGLILQAEGGTLLLDEIGDFPVTLQPKLLRALEERSLRPIGGEREIPFDVRVIATTNRDLESAVEAGRFREDLFYRLNVIQVELPPLRARGTDILLLSQHFVQQFTTRSSKHVIGISNTAVEKLLSYSWPGNVRELRNAIERAVVLTRHEKLTVEDLPERVRAYHSHHVLVGAMDPTELLPMEEVERRYILHVLQSVGGNNTLAARKLGFDRKTLYRKLQRYGAVDQGTS